MRAIHVDGVRCFATPQQIPLRPITLLLGENSTGKSTVLALTRLAWTLASGNPVVDFNEPPFTLGSFDQIASAIGRRSGRAKSFQVGATFEIGARNTREHQLGSMGTATISAIFEKISGHPVATTWRLASGDFALEVHRSLPDKEPHPVFGATKRGPEDSLRSQRLLLRIRDQTRSIETSFEPWLASLDRDLWSYSIRASSDLAKQGVDFGAAEASITGDPQIDAMILLAQDTRAALGPRPYAFAPIRTHPARTYDPLQIEPEPEGKHVPLLLARMASTDRSGWQALRSSLVDFGRDSGLFRDVRVQRKGSTGSDPFQLLVRVGGPAFNLVDVGYGVSQILPILVDILRGDPLDAFLLQQPEVHLHPKAQAALASLLCSLASNSRRRFMIETHSDHIVDRIRMDVRDGKSVRPEDVIILYFERKNGGVEVSPIEIDENGNLRGAPKTYRSFFLEEERRFFESS